MERVVAFKHDGGIVVPFSRLDRDPVAQLRVSGRPVVVLFKGGVVSVLDAAAIERSRDVGSAPPAPSIAAWAAGRSSSRRSAAGASAIARSARRGTSPAAPWPVSWPARRCANRA
jgi:hypothetical protein